MRRRILGEEHVADAIAGTSEVDRAFQDWITHNIWGDIWTRPDLDLRTRSLVTIAILAALDSEELEMHLRASANSGASMTEVTEVLLHVAAYAGAPAANRAFRVAKTVYEETGA